MKAEKVSIFILLFFLIVFLCVFFAPCALSQTVSFGYDAAGNQPDGIYILKIVIGEEESEWKVIKH